jgi:predicted ATP-dependent endonuclease of OLD family
MHIKGITVNNFMRLEMVALQLDGKNLVIGGDNHQGKSSLLNSFWVALGGSDAMDALDITRPIKNGAKDSRIELDLGDLIVKRKWIKNEESGAVNMYLEVVTPQGAKYPSPQKMLDALMGKMFDPFEFSEKKAKEQRELLLKLVDLGTFSLEGNAAERKTTFDQRTVVNREVLRLSQQVQGMGPALAGVPAEEVSVASVLQEQQAAQQQKEANDEERRKLQGLIQDHDSLKANIQTKENTIAELRRQLAKHEEELVTWRKDMDVLMAKGKEQHTKVLALQDPDLSVFVTKLKDLEETNAEVRHNKALAELEKELSKAQQESEQLTAKIKDLDAAKDKALRSAKFPVEGLSIDDEGITFKDVPLGQCSTEEKMRVCIAIAMAMSPQLKVIRISRAESLDPNNFKVITEMAAAGGYQLLMEKVGDPGDMGIIIEDGMVKGVEA